MDDVDPFDPAPPPASEDEPPSELYGGQEPWWWPSFSPIIEGSYGCGCLLVPFLFLMTSEKDGSFRIQLADVFCFVTLVSFLSSIEAFWGVGFRWSDRMWITPLIGLTCGFVLALIRQRLAWVLAGLTGVPLMWVLIAIFKEFGKLLAT